MNYYSEEEIRRILEPIMDFYVLDHAIQKMVPAIIPTSSDRERIRMELWCKLYSYPSTNEPRWDLQAAMNDFDKQFPK